ncbi:MAG: response regulator [Candidatus Thorarchaeota archaeon]
MYWERWQQLTAESTLAVIIAGDVPFLRVLLKMAIEDAGLTVVDEVTNRTDLIVSCLKKNPDVVILDLELEDDDNIRLVEDLLDIDSSLSIIAISDLVEDYTETILAAGARAYLQKPFSMYDLIELIKKVAPDSRLRASL